MSWFTKKVFPINPSLFNSASAAKLAEVEASIDAQYKARKRQEQLADKLICPSCAHHPIKETGYHELSGMGFYECPVCGWSGEGAMLI